MFDIIVNDYIAKNVPFTKRDCVHYIYFCAQMCNGTTAIADILRVIRSGRVDLQRTIRNVGNLYNALGYIAQQSSLLASGSCTHPRHTFCSKGKLVKNIQMITESLLDDIKTFDVEGRDSRMETKCHDLLFKFQSKVYEGCGTVTSHTLLHLCALTGLIPLRCYTYASLLHDKRMKTGPAQLIKMLSRETKESVTSAICAENIFRKLHYDLNKVWNGRITKSLLENMLCELNRMLKSSEQYKKTQQVGRVLSNEEIRNVFATNDEVSSKVLDTLFLYNHRCAERPLQSMFQCNVNPSGGGSPVMNICIKRFSKNGSVSNNIFPITKWIRGEITTWNCSKSQRVLVTWNKKGEIEMANDLQAYFKCRHECNKQNSCDLCDD